MNIQSIKKRVSGGGFKPFMMRTSDGREYPVQHPEWVLVGPRTIAVLDSDGEIVSLDALHIVALKDLPTHKNGAGK